MSDEANIRFSFVESPTGYAIVVIANERGARQLELEARGLGKMCAETGYAKTIFFEREGTTVEFTKAETVEEGFALLKKSGA